tara:strand:+ start:2452 stop:2790 length:339 start_codon:yes stop_codon:yes gene_type:complete
MKSKIEFNLEALESLCRLNCTHAEIAAYFNVSLKTVERRYKEELDFAAAVDRGKATGRLSLRRKQIELVDNGNASMAIWLGKQLLNQTDKQEIDQYNHGDKISIEIVNPDGI